MSDTPTELKYAQSHEWARLEPDNTITVGISDHAQDALGDVVFIELPELGAMFAAGAEVAVVESVKAASDIYAPLGGEVIAVNGLLEENPEIVNEDPYGEGWMFRLRAEDGVEIQDLLANLLSADAYVRQCEDA